jgi:hypothetical protein
MPYSAGQFAYKLAFEISPITLTGGVAQNIPGGMLPLVSVTQASSFTGFISGGTNVDPDDFFANFYPLPGSSLIEQQIGHYPFANQTVAANAIIVQPLTVSLLMRVPVRDTGGYASKLAQMTSLRDALHQHNTSGGTYTVATPSYFYTNTVMLGMHDVSSGETLQAQIAWRLDFEQPLISLQDAVSAQNLMMSQLSSGVQTTGANFGLSPTVGIPPSLAGPSVSPAAAGTASSGVAGQGIPGIQ